MKYFYLFFLINSIFANELIKKYDEEIFPKYRECFNNSYLYKSYKIHYCFIKGETDELFIISPGRNESGLKYMLVADRIYNYKKPNILVIDHINQGFSTRVIPNSTKMHIDDFNDFFNSTEELILQVIANKRGFSSIHALGHSMGAFILFEIAKRGHIKFSNLYLSAPMFSINTFKIPKIIIRALTSTLRNFGFSKNYAITQKEHQIKTFKKKNYLTSSKDRYDYAQYIYKKSPELKSSGSTYAWVDEVFKKYRYVTKNLDKIQDLNIFVFQSGDDLVVDNDLQTEVCKLLKNCKLIVSKEAYHDFIHEKDEIRSLIFQAMKIY